MTVSLEKTEIVEYYKPPLRPSTHQWTYAGQPLKVSDTFKYLGLWLHSTSGVKAAISPLEQAGTRAMWAMESRFRDMELRDLYMKVHLFNCVVKPVLSFGCEVWGPGELCTIKEAGDMVKGPLKSVQNKFLRHLGKLRKSTSLPIIYRELGCVPMARLWMQSIIRFWNRCVDMGENEWLHLAFRENLQMSSQIIRRGPKSWTSEVLQALKALGWDTGAASIEARRWYPAGHAIPGISEQEVMGLWDHIWQGQWMGPWPHPRQDWNHDFGLEGVKQATYDTWMAAGAYLDAGQMAQRKAPWYPPGLPRYVRFTHTSNQEHVRSLMRFRTGSHLLAVETGRWEQPPVPRSDRECLICGMNVVQDEFHLVLECPRMHDLRAKYARLFEELGGPHVVEDSFMQTWFAPERAELAKVHSTGMRAFMDQHPAQLAAFIHEALETAARLPSIDPSSLVEVYSDHLDVGSDGHISWVSTVVDEDDDGGSD